MVHIVLEYVKILILKNKQNGRFPIEMKIIFISRVLGIIDFKGINFSKAKIFNISNKQIILKREKENILVHAPQAGSLSFTSNIKITLRG